MRLIPWTLRSGSEHLLTLCRGFTLKLFEDFVPLTPIRVQPVHCCVIPGPILVGIWSLAIYCTLLKEPSEIPLCNA